MIPIERDANENSSVLLFVVCGDTLSVASMVEVAYYIGEGRKMVLCLMDIPSDGETQIEGMKVRGWIGSQCFGDVSELTDPRT